MAVDSRNNKIETDILITGYVRDLSNEYKTLFIPYEIKQLCFKYWFITVCDEWNTECLPADIEIHAQTAKSLLTPSEFKFQKQRTFYGTHKVESGIYSWHIKFITTINWICIGVIEADKDLMMKYQRSNSYRCFDHGCFLLTSNGRIYSGSTSAIYSHPIKQSGTIISITLNMDNHSLSYKLNDKDYGIAYDKLYKKGYSLAVTLIKENCIVQLL